ncbi:MAG: alpha/beta hydrolase, partial [Holophaga sp.]
HYRFQGNPQGAWIVLVNGLLSDTTMWAGTLPGLVSRFHVITFDCRGQGRSDTPVADSYPVAVMADDLWEMLNLLNIQRPWLVGLSNGANLSLELLAGHPGAFAGAVLTSSAPCVDFTSRLRVLHWIHCLQVGGPLMQFDAVAPYLWGDRFLAARHSVLRAYHQARLEASGQTHTVEEAAFLGATRQMMGILDWDIRGRLGAVVDPVLFLAGGEDLLTPPWKCLETAKGVKGSRFEVIPGVGHAFPVEDPKAFATRVTDFIHQVSNPLQPIAET